MEESIPKTCSNCRHWNPKQASQGDKSFCNMSANHIGWSYFKRQYIMTDKNFTCDLHWEKIVKTVTLNGKFFNV